MARIFSRSQMRHRRDRHGATRELIGQRRCRCSTSRRGAADDAWAGLAISAHRSRSSMISSQSALSSASPIRLSFMRRSRIGDRHQLGRIGLAVMPQRGPALLEGLREQKAIVRLNYPPALIPLLAFTVNSRSLCGVVVAIHPAAWHLLTPDIVETARETSPPIVRSACRCERIDQGRERPQE